jgi:pyridine nucleotide-disulfide oxidoreductase family protein
LSERCLVLLGIGHTHAHVVRQWMRQPIAHCRLVCISNFPYATYSGMLPGTLARQFEPSEMQVDLAALCAAAGAELSLAQVERVDPERREIHFRQTPPLQFDALSIGVGSMPAGCHDFQSELLVPIKPMQTFLQRFDGCIQRFMPEGLQANLEPIRVTIVGGGVASVEIALCAQTRLKQQFAARSCVIQIVTAGADIASELTPRSVRRIKELLQACGITVIATTRISEVTQRAAVDSQGVEYPADCIIWATGAVGPPILSQLGLPLDEKGFIATDRTLRSVTGAPIFAVGDSGTIVDAPVPKAGVYAVRQSPILWHNLRAILGTGKLNQFKPQRDFLKLLNTGNGKAILQYGSLTFYARWCGWLKTYIDKQFITKYQQPF